MWHQQDQWCHHPAPVAVQEMQGRIAPYAVHNSCATAAALIDVQQSVILMYSDSCLSVVMCTGRVKTLHPGVHGGILAIRGNPAHMDAIKQHNIQPIDLVRHSS
jgi:AICAR transformylase/IMP cyclohydrolase PurH